MPNNLMLSKGFPLKKEGSLVSLPGPPVVHYDPLGPAGGGICNLHGFVEPVYDQESEEGWTECAALGPTCVQDQSGGCGVPYSHHLGPFGEDLLLQVLELQDQLELKSTIASLYECVTTSSFIFCWTDVQTSRGDDLDVLLNIFPTALPKHS